MQPVAVTAAALTDNVATLEVASLATLRVGYQVQVLGVGTNYDGIYIITATDTLAVVNNNVTTYTYTISYAKTHANIAEAEVAGRVTPRCTWIGSAEVEDFLGFEPTAAPDQSWLDACVEAANEWCCLRRYENGYDDYFNHVPSSAVQNGTVMYAAAMFRERGSVDSFQSFTDMPMPTTLAGSMGQISRLLGLAKPRVA